MLELADQVLAVAPQHPEARRARGMAWKSVEPVTVVTPLRTGGASARRKARRPEPSQRFLLWIDGVGGYLVCLGNRVTFGQATPDGYVDVPLVADVSRLHATLTRDNGGYVLEAMRPVQVNGQPAEKALLRPGDRVTLGTSCQLQFRQPVPVERHGPARPGERPPPAAGGGRRAADGRHAGARARPQVHVAVPDLKQPVVLFRHKDGLGVRCPGAFLIDGQRCQERGLLRPTSTRHRRGFCLRRGAAGVAGQ